MAASSLLDASIFFNFKQHPMSSGSILILLFYKYKYFSLVNFSIDVMLSTGVSFTFNTINLDKFLTSNGSFLNFSQFSIFKVLKFSQLPMDYGSVDIWACSKINFYSFVNFSIDGRLSICALLISKLIKFNNFPTVSGNLFNFELYSFNSLKFKQFAIDYGIVGISVFCR